MADTKISALTGLAGANVDTATDVLPIVDTSVATTKKILVDDLRISLSATQTLQEAGTNVSTFVMPSIQQHHRSAAKGWIDFNGTGTVSTRAAYNATLTDNGTGDYTVSWTVPFSSADYAASIMSPLEATASDNAIQIVSKTAAAIRFQTREDGAATDKTYVWVMAYGDQ